MSTCDLQVILFPEDDTAPRLVPLKFHLDGRKDRPGVFPSGWVQGELERVLANGRATDLLSFLNCEYHMIAPRLAGINSDQLYLMYWEGAGIQNFNLSLAHFTDGKAPQGWTRNLIVIKSSPVHDIWQDAELEADLPILKRYLSWFPGD